MTTKRTAILFSVLFCTTAVAPKTAYEPGASPAIQNAATDANDVKTDIDRMRVLLSQMQKNAAFVSRGDTPLKHEFELEIEMWQLLLQDMEKKVNAGKVP